MRVQPRVEQRAESNLQAADKNTWHVCHMSLDSQSLVNVTVNQSARVPGCQRPSDCNQTELAMRQTPLLLPLLPLPLPILL